MYSKSPHANSPACSQHPNTRLPSFDERKWENKARPLTIDVHYLAFSSFSHYCSSLQEQKKRERERAISNSYPRCMSLYKQSFLVFGSSVVPDSDMHLCAYLSQGRKFLASFSLPIFLILALESLFQPCSYSVALWRI